MSLLFPSSAGSKFEPTEAVRKMASSLSLQREGVETFVLALVLASELLNSDHMLAKHPDWGRGSI